MPASVLAVRDDVDRQLIDRIEDLKRQRKAVILAHLYQRPEIQELADYVGDSLGLSQQAAATDAEVIVFCGVHFMAETAAILSPDKLVLLPEEEAGCPMANMVTVSRLRQKKAEHPDAVVVAYVNTEAQVKAEADICCTSSNAVKVVESIPRDRKILFVPDMHLGHWVAQKTGREMIFMKGFCPTHNKLSAEMIDRLKEAHPEAVVMVHPECRPEVVARADIVSSTAGMIKYATQSSAKEFIVGTEEGVLHQMKKKNPGKTFFLANERMICPNMKATRLEQVAWSLEDLEPRITVSAAIRDKAKAAVDRMLAVT